MEYQGQPATECWCGNTGLVAFSPDYLRCPACETLVIAKMPDPEWLIAPGERGFYGREYYEKYLIEQFGFPSLPERARADLPERCLYWLRTLLRYRLPPGKVLELGSAHGGFVALLRWAGFDAIGLEVSPWLVEFARRTFDVPMLLGAIEEQDLEPASFDVIAAMDVIEHLPDPVRSLKRCAELLKPDGLLLIQTPCFPEGKAHTQLVEENAPFLSTMVPPHHLFLFSRRSLTRLLAELGLGYLQFEPNLFPYDMFLLAGRHPLARYPWEHVTRRLEDAPQARLIRGLFDLDDQLQDLRKRYIDAEADRAARLEVIERQGSQLGELEQARSQLQQLLQQTQLRQVATESEREALRQALEQVQAELQASRQVQAELNRQMAELHQRLGAAEADRAARFEVIQRQDRQLGELEQARAAAAARLEEVCRELERAHERETSLQHRIAELEQQLAVHQAEYARALEAEQQNFARQAEELRRELDAAYSREADARANLDAIRQELADTQSERDALRQEAGALSSERQFVRAVLDRLRLSLVYRTMRSLGLWGWLTPVVEPHDKSRQPPSEFDKPRRLKRIAVDLTPVLPGGDNGGAKVMTLALIKALARAHPETQFVLLTSKRSHAELSRLEADNVKCVCVTGADGVRTRLLTALLSKLAEAFGLVHSPALEAIRHRLTTALTTGPHQDLLSRLEADLLFCPFTAPFFHQPGIPTVCVIYDLQYLDLPEFFDEAERAERHRAFRQACMLSTRLVCISEFVRRRVLKEGLMPPDRVFTIHITLARRLPHVDAAAASRILGRYGLEAKSYLLYPANFWPHKNHEMLLTAFGEYCARHSQSGLRLVLTGAPGPRMEFLREATARMGLAPRVIFAGYVPDEEFAALLHGARALVFPSLYEGFGMPLVEAMAAGIPVLASDATSLPEVLGAAGILFDPRKPKTIVASIEQLESDPSLVEQLVARGLARVAELGDEKTMADRYWRVFEEALYHPVAHRPVLHGVYPDGWAAPRLTLNFEAGPEGRYLLLAVQVPGWVPWPGVTLRWLDSKDRVPSGRAIHHVARGELVQVQHPLPASGGRLQAVIEPVFQLRALNIGSDSRWLSFRVLDAEIRYPDSSVQKLECIPYVG